MMEQTRIFTALKGVRGRKAVDLDRLERLIVCFSQLVVEQSRIAEIDINPLLVSSDQLLALDARVVLHGPDIDESHLPKPVITPYPLRFVSDWTLRNGIPVTIRPIRPEDEPLMVRFHGTLSERSVYFRYFHLIGLSQRVAHERLTRMCFVDYDRQMALVADYKDPQSGERQILAVARLTKVRGANEAEFAVVVGDCFQHLGLGTQLVHRLLEVARDEKLERVVADILPENGSMQEICRRLGFRLRHSTEEQVVKAELSII